jgi:hypothetical protein
MEEFMKIGNKNFISFMLAIMFGLGLFVWGGLPATADDKGINFTYEIDMNATDSGVTTVQGNRTIKDIQTLVGASKKCTLVFKHSGSGVTKACTIGTAITLTNNFYLDIRPGAEFTLNANLTVASRGHIKITEGQTVKGAGTAALLYTDVDETLHGWKKLEGGYTATPASTSSVTMTSDRTASILPGMSLRYVISGTTTYYGRVQAITSDLLTVNGPPLSATITSLSYDGGVVREIIIIIPGLYEDATNLTLIASDLKSQFIWRLPTSYLVKYWVYSRLHDTGQHGVVSVKINGANVNMISTNLTIAADAVEYSTVVDLDSAYYDINTLEAIEIKATRASGGNGDAEDLTVGMIFVTP